MIFCRVSSSPTVWRASMPSASAAEERDDLGGRLERHVIDNREQSVEETALVIEERLRLETLTVSRERSAAG